MTDPSLTNVLLIEPVVLRKPSAPAGRRVGPEPPGTPTWLATKGSFTSAYEAAPARPWGVRLSHVGAPYEDWRHAPRAVHGPVPLELGGVTIQLFVAKQPWDAGYVFGMRGLVRGLFVRGGGGIEV
jgi:hypothetical protein